MEQTMATGAAALISIALRKMLSSGSSRKNAIVISGRMSKRSAVTKYTCLS